MKKGVVLGHGFSWGCSQAADPAQLSEGLTGAAGCASKMAHLQFLDTRPLCRVAHDTDANFTQNEQPKIESRGESCEALYNLIIRCHFCHFLC